MGKDIMIICSLRASGESLGFAMIMQSRMCVAGWWRIGLEMFKMVDAFMGGDFVALIRMIRHIPSGGNKYQ